LNEWTAGSYGGIASYPGYSLQEVTRVESLVLGYKNYIRSAPGCALSWWLLHPCHKMIAERPDGDGRPR